jgi:hypothetical protein
MIFDFEHVNIGVLRMLNKRMLWHRMIRLARDFFYTCIGRKCKHIIFDAPHYFHYLHIEPIILAMRGEQNIKITVLKWDDFDDKYKLPGIKYICRDDVQGNVFHVYDCYFTTEHSGIFWWFGEDVLKIYLLHTHHHDWGWAK